MRDELCGVYNVYHSSCIPRHIVVGNLAIDYDDTTRSFFTTEKYMLSAPPMPKPEELILYGCIVKVRDGERQGLPEYRLFSQNLLTEMPQVMVLGGIEGPPVANVTSMRGTMIDFHKRKPKDYQLYAANLLLRRAGVDCPLDQPRLVSRDDFDDQDVKAALSRSFTINEGVVSFPL